MRMSRLLVVQWIDRLKSVLITCQAKEDQLESEFIYTKIYT